MSLITEPWPWWVAGPAVGITVPLLYLLAGKRFGISSSFRHLCAAVTPSKAEYFSYDWARIGGWNLAFVIGLVGGGAAAVAMSGGDLWTVDLAQSTVDDIAGLGVTQRPGLVPTELFSWGALGTVGGWVTMVLGGWLVGFGARYADGCTSGHAITGMALLQRQSLIAVIGFFVGGLVSVHLVLPWVL